MFPLKLVVFKEKAATPSLSVVRFCSRRDEDIASRLKWTSLSGIGVLSK